jgi:hypothetical protein
VFIPAAGADNVKNETFQLDGNIATGVTSPVTYDWASFFNSSGGKLSLPTGYTASAFVKDFNTTTDRKGNTVFDTNDSSTYTIGSKDTLDVNGWSCTPANNVTDKGDIMNAYAVAYTDPVSGHKFMFFGLERNANAGDANVAFWFLAGSASCPTAGGSFTGTHHNGDLLIVSAFTNGGSVSNINAYEWQNGALNTTPVANGGDCRSAVLTADPTCATSNTAALTGIPWQTENKADGVGHTLQSGEFFEGGLDLSAPSVNLANNCFNTFIPDTRSSQSLTATLYDFAIGGLGECRTNLSTTAGDSSTVPDNNNGQPGTASPSTIGGGSVSSGSDTAGLQVTGVSSWSGTLTFYLCGPLASFPTSGSGPACHDASGNETGVQVGSAINVSETDNAVHNFVSGTATLTSAGKYCWTAHFEPSQTSSGNGVGAQDDNNSNECFTVGKATPTLTTCSGSYSAAGVCTASSAVAFGNPIHDYAKLSNLATEPGSNGASHGGNSNWPTINATDLSYAGAISFLLKGPSASGCGSSAPSSTTNPNPQSVAVDSTTGNKVYGPVSYTPGTPGVYHWQATVDDLSSATPPVELSVNNNLPQSENNANCTDTNEDVTVQQIPTHIKTKQSWIPNDTATVSADSGNLASGGSVEFQLFNNSTCSGTALYDETVSVPGGNASAEVSTSNAGSGAGGLTITSGYADLAGSVAGPYSWKVVYTPAAADTAHTGTQSSCDAEHFGVTYTNDPGPN